MAKEATQFRKGQSGNPGGRPAVIAEVRDLARRHTAEAIETLAQICRSGQSESARVSAATALLDRGYGKPTMFLESKGQSLVDYSDEELMTIIARAAVKSPQDDDTLLH